MADQSQHKVELRIGYDNVQYAAHAKLARRSGMWGRITTVESWNGKRTEWWANPCAETRAPDWFSPNSKEGGEKNDEWEICECVSLMKRWDYKGGLAIGCADFVLQLLHRVLKRGRGSSGRREGAWVGHMEHAGIIASRGWRQYRTWTQRGVILPWASVQAENDHTVESGSEAWAAAIDKSNEDLQERFSFHSSWA